MKIHLRTAEDMGKTKSTRTFCNMHFKLKFFTITESPKNVTCNRCISKMERMNKVLHGGSR